MTENSLRALTAARRNKETSGGPQVEAGTDYHESWDLIFQKAVDQARENASQLRDLLTGFLNEDRIKILSEGKDKGEFPSAVGSMMYRELKPAAEKILKNTGATNPIERVANEFILNGLLENGGRFVGMMAQGVSRGKANKKTNAFIEDRARDLERHTEKHIKAGLNYFWNTRQQLGWMTDAGRSVEDLEQRQRTARHMIGKIKPSSPGDLFFRDDLGRAVYGEIRSQISKQELNREDTRKLLDGLPKNRKPGL